MTTADGSTNRTKRRWRLSRRQFLIGLGATAGTAAVGLALGIPYGRLKLAEMIDGGGGGFFTATNDPWAWFEVTVDGSLLLHIAKVEMGQGVHTALKQVAAAELGVAWDALSVRQGTTHVGPEDGGGTIGSMSVASTYSPLREAAATFAYLLRQEAAGQTGLAMDALQIRDDGFGLAEGETLITFAAIVRNKQGDWEVPVEAVPLKPLADLVLIGKPMPRVDIPAKVTGAAVYGFDARLPGMKFGAVLRSPTIAGRLLDVDTSDARALPGVLTVIEAGDFVGVVAESRRVAWAAVEAIRATWDEGRLWQQAELEDLVTVGGPGGVLIQKVGDSLASSNEAAYAADYHTPLAVQTPLEPQAALAEATAAAARVWVSTQTHTSLQQQVADALDIEASSVEIIPTYLGGGFGRKLGDVAVEAAQLAQGAGVPVHLGWTRTEELTAGFMQPLSHHRLFGVLDSTGRISGLEHQVGSGDILFSFFPDALAAVFGADIGVTRGAALTYNVPNRHTTVWRRSLPVKTGSWRGLGLLPNTFAIESFMDELAHQAGYDPLRFRLAHLGEDERSQRYAAVLEAAAAGWGALPAGRARGLAGNADGQTVVAAMAEVSVAANGQVRVHRIRSAMDCGLVINPDGAKAQMEGNAMWGVSAALKEEVTLKDGRIDLVNFDTYPLLTMAEAPVVEAILVNSGQSKPYGVGEPPIAPIAAAIGNAIFTLTGKRLRRLPFTPERVLAAPVARR